MENNNVSQKTGNGFMILFIIALFVILGLSFYICYDKGIILKNKNSNETSKESQENNDITKKEPIEEKESSSITPKCYGTYYGEAKGIGESSSYNLKYTYVLKEDGTFTADFSGVSGTNGVYVINDNTISFIGRREITGPRDAVPYYDTEDYVIADDCSTITIVYDGLSFNLQKQ